VAQLAFASIGFITAVKGLMAAAARLLIAFVVIVQASDL
jgi:hypothetical protein